MPVLQASCTLFPCCWQEISASDLCLPAALGLQSGTGQEQASTACCMEPASGHMHTGVYCRHERDLEARQALPRHDKDASAHAVRWMLQAGSCSDQGARDGGASAASQRDGQRAGL